MSILAALGAIAYGISPIDVIPELLVGPLGFGDDAVVVIGAGIAIWKLLTGSKRGPASAQAEAPPTEVPPYHER
jgi:uncharacterized membrane protein YkvA (DUF1232 family)